MTITQTLTRRKRKLYVARDAKGRFIKVSSSKEGFAKKLSKDKKKLKKADYYSKIDKKRRGALKKHTRYGKLDKKNIKSKIKLTKVDEYVVEKPLRRKKGQMQAKFAFFKKVGKRVLRREATGYSKVLSFPRDNEKAFNQCLAHAVVQAAFTPDDFIVIYISYIYYYPR